MNRYSTHLPDCYPDWVALWNQVKEYEHCKYGTFVQQQPNGLGHDMLYYDVRFVKEQAFIQMLEEKESLKDEDKYLTIGDLSGIQHELSVYSNSSFSCYLLPKLKAIIDFRIEKEMQSRKVRK